MKKLASLYIMFCCGILLHSLEVKGTALAQRASFVSKVDSVITRGLGLAGDKNWGELKKTMDMLAREVAAISPVEVEVLMQEEDIVAQLKAWVESQTLNLRSILGKIGAYDYRGEEGLFELIRNDFDHVLIEKIGLTVFLPKLWGDDISLAKLASLPLVQQAIILDKIVRNLGYGSASIDVFSEGSGGVFREIRKHVIRRFYRNRTPQNSKEIQVLFNVNLRDLMPASSALTYDDFRPLSYGSYSSELRAIQAVMEAAGQGFPQLPYTFSQLTDTEMDAVRKRIGLADLWNSWEEERKNITWPSNKVEEAVMHDLNSYAAMWLFSWVTVNEIYGELVSAVKITISNR